MSKLEKDVKEEVNKALQGLEQSGKLLWYSRMQAGKVNVGYQWIHLGRNGNPDYIAFFKHKNIVYVYLIELKRESGGEWRGEQRECCSKFSGIENCIYEVVTDYKQLYRTIEGITKEDQNILDSINFTND